MSAHSQSSESNRSSLVPTHNLKVIGSNPIPATKLSLVDQILRSGLPGFSFCAYAGVKRKLLAEDRLHVRAARDTVMSFPDLPYGNLGLPQYETERILGEHLAQFGIGVERGIKLAALRDDGRRVAVELSDANGRSEMAEFRYVVGCDGARSAVRHALDIAFPGDRFPMPFMLGDGLIDWDLPRGVGAFSIVPRKDDAPDFLVAIPLPPRNRYRVSPAFVHHNNGRPGPLLAAKKRGFIGRLQLGMRGAGEYHEDNACRGRCDSRCHRLSGIWASDGG
jgi:FAD binding domain